MYVAESLVAQRMKAQTASGVVMPTEAAAFGIGAALTFEDEMVRVDGARAFRPF